MMGKVACDQTETDAQQGTAESWPSPHEGHDRQQRNAPKHVVNLEQRRGGGISRRAIASA